MVAQRLCSIQSTNQLIIYFKPLQETSSSTTTTEQPDSPVAMHRIGFNENEEYDYDFEPRKKFDSSSILENSVEEKTKYKHGNDDVKRGDSNKFDEEDEVSVDSHPESSDYEEVHEEKKDEDENEENPDEEVPRRGM